MGLTCPQRRCSALAAAVLIAFGLASCGEPASAPKEPAARPSPAVSGGSAIDPSNAPNLQRLARALALALADKGTREAVRDLLRASPYSLHSVNLQDLMRTDAGHALAARMSKAAGERDAELAELIASLPRVDLAMPMSEHRLTWTPAAGDVRVAGMVDRHGNQALGYDVTGLAHSLTRDNSRSHPVLVIWPAYPLARRMDLAAYKAGAVVQDPGENEVSGTMTVTGPGGVSLTTDLADLQQSMASLSSSAGRPIGAAIVPPPSPDTTWLTEIYDSFPLGVDGIFSIVDPYLNVCYRSIAPNGPCVLNVIDRFNGLHMAHDYQMRVPLILARVTDSTTDGITINGRALDFFGKVFDLATFQLSWTSRIWRDSVNGTKYCDVNFRLCASFYAREKFFPTFTAAISGPIQINPQCPQGSWYAQVTGGKKPYTYQWSVNGVATSNQPTIDISGITSDFTLYLMATDALQETYSVSERVLVSTSAPACQV